MNLQRGLKRWISMGAVALLAVAGTTLAGIQGTGFRALAAFGTVETSNDPRGMSVNGVPYDMSHAHVVVNGRPGDVSQLRSGHIVAARGSHSNRKSPPSADEIVLESDVRGEVTSVDEVNGVFSVLGQTIQLTEQSILDSRIQSIRSGMWVKVSAFERSDGSFDASRVDLDLAPGESQVRGVARSLDRRAQTLRVGGLTVDYSSATPQGEIAEGAVVVARGLQPQSGGTLFASYVGVFNGVGHGGEHGDIEGMVTTFASPADFEVNGQPVLADERTVYVLHGQSLAPDLQVRVTGRFDATGVLIAHKVQADSPKKPKHGPPGKH
jgi:uncharacterized protein DUF5666